MEIELLVPFHIASHIIIIMLHTMTLMFTLTICMTYILLVCVEFHDHAHTAKGTAFQVGVCHGTCG